MILWFTKLESGFVRVGSKVNTFDAIAFYEQGKNAISCGDKLNQHPLNDCPFCRTDLSQILFGNELAIVVWDAYPVSPGHALIIPRRHITDFFQTTRKERGAISDLLESIKSEIVRRYRPSGFNLGVNVGESAGQTIEHTHMHVIPRYFGDVQDPRGGIRGVIPSKRNY